jgi:hypothetical protein
MEGLLFCSIQPVFDPERKAFSFFHQHLLKRKKKKKMKKMLVKEKNTVDYHVDYNDIKKVLENMQNLAAIVNSSVHLENKTSRNNIKKNIK